VAVGEIVETQPSSGFEGYYRNETATAERFRDGAYWSGDLAYRDADGWLYFAGRSNEWLRVDGENFSAGPVESIIGRHPDVRSVAVYAVPDDPVGDRVMVALELWDGATFDPQAFDQFLAEQADLGPKWVPAFVRVDADLPKLSSLKIDKNPPLAFALPGALSVLRGPSTCSRGSTPFLCYRLPGSLRRVSFCTRQFMSSATYKVFGSRQSIALTMPNSLNCLPARPNLPSTVPSSSIL